MHLRAALKVTEILGRVDQLQPSECMHTSPLHCSGTSPFTPHFGDCRSEKAEPQGQRTGQPWVHGQLRVPPQGASHM